MYIIVAEYFEANGNRDYKFLKKHSFEKGEFVKDMNEIKQGNTWIAKKTPKLTASRATPEGWSNLYAIPVKKARTMYAKAGNKNWHTAFSIMNDYKI